MPSFYWRRGNIYNVSIGTVEPPLRIPAPRPPAAPGSRPRRVLMLAYRFPPASSAIASRRPEGLYRHLPQFGWEPHVITTQNDLGLPNISVVADRSIAGRRESTAFESAASSKSPRWKAKLRNVAKRVAKRFPAGYDAYARWSCDAAEEATRLGREVDYDLIWATLSPLSLGYAAHTASVETGIPFVLDLRDPPEEGLGGIDAPWFTQALQAASAVTIAAPSCITPLVQHYCAATLLTLTGAWKSEPQKPRPAETFNIVHAGTWHPSYNPTPLFEAVSQLAAESSDFASKARLIFVGKGSAAVEQSTGFANVKSMADSMPLMPHAAVSGLIAGASVLLIARSMSGFKSQAITGKLFEYVPYEIPLLSIGGVNDLHAALVRWLGGTWTNDAEEIAGFLRAAFAKWRSTGIAHAPRNPQALAYLTQQRMAAETATVLHAVADKAESMGTQWANHVPDVQVTLRAEAPWPA